MHKLTKNVLNKELIVSQVTQLLKSGDILVVVPYEGNNISDMVKPNVVYGHRFVSISDTKQNGLKIIDDAYKVFENGNMSAIIYMECYKHEAISKLIESKNVPTFVLSTVEDNSLSNGFGATVWKLMLETFEQTKWFMAYLLAELKKHNKVYDIYSKGKYNKEIKNVQRNWLNQWSIITPAKRSSRIYKVRRSKRAKDYKRGA